MSALIEKAGRIAVWGCIVLLFLSICPCTSSAEAADSATVPTEQMDNVFDVANEQYKAGNYEDAIRLYNSLLSGDGLKTADMSFNLGNAYYRLQHHGKAIASYRRALRLAPRDQDIIANLDYVRGLTRDKIDQPKSTELLREIFFFHYGVSQAESETIFLCAYIAAASLAICCLFFKPRFLRLLTAVALGLALVFGASTASRWYGAAYPSDAVIVVDEADVHTGPGDHYLMSFNLHDGAEVTVRQRGDDWYQIELPDGRRGWLKRSQVEIV